MLIKPISLLQIDMALDPIHGHKTNCGHCRCGFTRTYNECLQGLFMPVSQCRISFNPYNGASWWYAPRTLRGHKPHFGHFSAGVYSLASTSATVAPMADGVGLIITPSSFSMATFSAALSPAEEIIAPAWPIRRPSGAVRPAM